MGKLLTRLRERERESRDNIRRKKEGEEMCVYFFVSACVDDTNNGKEVCKKKKEGRNTIFNTHTRERILLKKKPKNKQIKKEHLTD